MLFCNFCDIPNSFPLIMLIEDYVAMMYSVFRFSMTCEGCSINVVEYFNMFIDSVVGWLYLLIKLHMLLCRMCRNATWKHNLLQDKLPKLPKKAFLLYFHWLTLQSQSCGEVWSFLLGYTLFKDLKHKESIKCNPPKHTE